MYHLVSSCHRRPRPIVRWTTNSNTTTVKRRRRGRLCRPQQIMRKPPKILRSIHHVHVFVCWLLMLSAIAPPSSRIIVLFCYGQPTADTDYDEFVQQVVDEDEDHHFNDYATMDDSQADELRRKQDRQQQEKLRIQQDQQDKHEHERNEKIRREREVAFQKELDKMSEDKRKRALKQQKKDAKLVRKILRAADKMNKNPYKVLGFRNSGNRGIRIPARSIPILPKNRRFTLHLPEINLFYITSQRIKRQYRQLAKRIHPDKCRDGRAVQAFVAVEEAASLLLDEKARTAYDTQVIRQRQERREHIQHMIGTGMDRTWIVTSQIVGSIRRILGPFAFPVLILTLLIV